MKLMDKQSGTIIATRVRTAYHFIHRLKGLMFDRTLPVEETLHIKPCRSIHTCFMRFPIDVVYLDHNLEIVHLEMNVKPYRFGKTIKRANSVMEMTAGAIEEKGLFIGQALWIKTNSKGSV